MSDDDQNTLFELEELHIAQREWVGMPEFVQGRVRPYKTLIVRFASEEDYQDFATRIGQALTPLTKSIWHPQLVRGLHGKKRWVSR